MGAAAGGTCQYIHYVQNQDLCMDVLTKNVTKKEQWLNQIKRLRTARAKTAQHRKSAGNNQEQAVNSSHSLWVLRHVDYYGQSTWAIIHLFGY